MNDLDAISKLQEIGAKQINIDTKIAISKIQDILNKNFQNLDNTQAMGFISLLQSTYKVDLSTWIEEYQNYKNAEKPKNTDEVTNSLLVSKVEISSRKINFKIIIIVTCILMIMGVIVYSLGRDDNTVSEAAPMAPIEQKSAIEAPKIEEAPPVQEVLTLLPNELTIIPKGELWISITDLQSYKNTQKIINEPFQVVLENDSVIATGNGELKIVIDGKEEEFNTSTSMKFSYTKADNAIKQIKYSTYRKLLKAKSDD